MISHAGQIQPRFHSRRKIFFPNLVVHLIKPNGCRIRSVGWCMRPMSTDKPISFEINQQWVKVAIAGRNHKYHQQKIHINIPVYMLQPGSLIIHFFPSLHSYYYWWWYQCSSNLSSFPPLYYIYIQTSIFWKKNVNVNNDTTHLQPAISGQPSVRGAHFSAKNRAVSHAKDQQLVFLPL